MNNAGKVYEQELNKEYTNEVSTAQQPVDLTIGDYRRETKAKKGFPLKVPASHLCYGVFYQDRKRVFAYIMQ